MTLTNESIEFTPFGIWIQPLLSRRFKFDGSASDLIAIMVNHPELDIDSPRFFVRNSIELLPAIPGHSHVIGDNGTPTCGCTFQWPPK